MSKIIRLSLNRKPDHEMSESVSQLVEELQSRTMDMVVLVTNAARVDEEGQVACSFRGVEEALRAELFAFARCLLTLFVMLSEQSIRRRLPSVVIHAGKAFRKADAVPRNLNTMFGVIRYARTYMRPITGSTGYHPLDVAVGLTRGRTSFNLLTCAVSLALKLSFSEARSTLDQFVEQPPSTEVIEKATLGLGRFSAEYFEQASAPDVDGPDGEVLVIMPDGKGIPTAKEQELAKRRGKRIVRKHSPSKRHRGRKKRQRSPRKRRKKGDKSKNARMATLLVMYTLRREGDILVGPLNIFRYASLAPKRHAFEIAVREAKKRGFVAAEDGSFANLPDGKVVQVVIDGDPDLAHYTSEYLPGAIVTIDVMHVLEYVHRAGKTIHREGSSALDEWFSKQKDCLYSGKLDDLLDELRAHLRAVPKTGPGTKKRRKALGAAIDYMDTRRHMLNYDELIKADLEITTGAVEGSVKFVIAKRFDHGGMRWIRERAEALLQLRCIYVNGQWKDFLDFVHRKVMAAEAAPFRLLQDEPAPLPKVTRKAA